MSDRVQEWENVYTWTRILVYPNDIGWQVQGPPLWRLITYFDRCAQSESAYLLNQMVVIYIYQISEIQIFGSRELI